MLIIVWNQHSKGNQYFNIYIPTTDGNRGEEPGDEEGNGGGERENRVEKNLRIPFSIGGFRKIHLPIRPFDPFSMGPFIPSTQGTNGSKGSLIRMSFVQYGGGSQRHIFQRLNNSLVFGEWWRIFKQHKFPKSYMFSTTYSPSPEMYRCHMQQFLDLRDSKYSWNFNFDRDISMVGGWMISHILHKKNKDAFFITKYILQ